MTKLRTRILHDLKLESVLLVEKAITDSKEYPTRTELWKSLPRKMQYQTYRRILEYLETSGKIGFDHRKIIYTGVNNPKLEALLRFSKQPL